MNDFFYIFVISESAEILIELNFWLAMWVPQVLNLNISQRYNNLKIVKHTKNTKNINFS